MFRPRSSILSSACVAFALSAPVVAQNFNLDVGAAGGNPVPAATFGAGAARPGTWGIAPTVVGAPQALTNIQGVLTTVTSTMSAGGNFASVGNLAGATVDDLNLMSDIMDLGALASMTWTFSGLAAGEYDLYTYAMAPDDGTFRTRIDVAGSIDPAQDVGGVWPNAYVLGTTHARHRVTVAPGGSIVVTVSETPAPPAPATNFGSINGFQIVVVPPPIGIAFCFGDNLDPNVTTDCPCSNFGAPGRGCASSFNPSGAGLVATGSVPSDTAVLNVDGVNNTGSVIFMRGDVNNVVGAVFGDGVRCVDGILRRRNKPIFAPGQASFPAPGETVTLSNGWGAGNDTPPGSGITAYYMAYYRNAAGAFCPPETFNGTNAWAITW